MQTHDGEPNFRPDVGARLGCWYMLDQCAWLFYHTQTPRFQPSLLQAHDTRPSLLDSPPCLYKY